MVYTIETDRDGFYIVKHLGKQIIKKSTLLQATKALAKYEKGRN